MRQVWDKYEPSERQVETRTGCISVRPHERYTTMQELCETDRLTVCPFCRCTRSLCLLTCHLCSAYLAMFGIRGYVWHIWLCLAYLAMFGILGYVWHTWLCCRHEVRRGWCRRRKENGREDMFKCSLSLLNNEVAHLLALTYLPYLLTSLPS